MIKQFSKKRGMYLPVVLFSGTLFLAFALAIVSISYSNLRLANLRETEEKSKAIAEAGINYYTWHLSHNNTDFCDGATCPEAVPYGPFVHDYKNNQGETIGQYELFITPSSINKSSVTVKSTGKLIGTRVEKTIVADIGMPSFSTYTLFTNNTELFLNNGQKINGSVFVNNNGLRNEGEITGNAFSTERRYSSPSLGALADGVNGSGIFGGSKLYPVTRIDMNRLDVDMANLRIKARILDNSYFDSSGNLGYHVILGSDSYEIRTIKKYDVQTNMIEKESPGMLYEYPESGLIFIEDDLWIEGQINNHKVTFVADDPEAGNSKRKRIVLTNSVMYSNYDGSDKIGLIAQSDIIMAQNTPLQTEIDAGMIAISGLVKMEDYPGVQKNKIKIFGSIAHNGGLIWKHEKNGAWTGFANFEFSSDNNSILNPPPNFPLTGTYSIMNWKSD